MLYSNTLPETLYLSSVIEGQNPKTIDYFLTKVDRFENLLRYIIGRNHSSPYEKFPGLTQEKFHEALSFYTPFILSIVPEICSERAAVTWNGKKEYLKARLDRINSSGKSQSKIRKKTPAHEFVATLFLYALNPNKYYS